MEQQLEYEELSRDNSPLLEEIAADASEESVVLIDYLRSDKSRATKDLKTKLVAKDEYKKLRDLFKKYEDIELLYKNNLISKSDYKKFGDLSTKVQKGIDYQIGAYFSKDASDTYANNQLVVALGNLFGLGFIGGTIGATIGNFPGAMIGFLGGMLVGIAPGFGFGHILGNSALKKKQQVLRLTRKKPQRA